MKGRVLLLSIRDVIDVVFGYKPLFCSASLQLSWVL